VVQNYFGSKAKVKFSLNFYKWRNYSDEVSAKEFIWKLILHSFKVRNRDNPERSMRHWTLSIDLTHSVGVVSSRSFLRVWVQHFGISFWAVSDDSIPLAVQFKFSNMCGWMGGTSPQHILPKGWVVRNLLFEWKKQTKNTFPTPTALSRKPTNHPAKNLRWSLLK